MNTVEKLGKAMDLLKRAAEHLGDCAPPDPTWFGDLFLLTGEHMILTDEGWETGESKQAYLDEDARHPGFGSSILDEVNAPCAITGESSI